MSVSIFSFLMAIFWCNIFIVIVTILKSHISFIAHFSLTPLLLLMGVCIFRLLFVLEIPNAIVIPSSYAFPRLIDFLTEIRFSVGNGISILHILLGMWIAGFLLFAMKYMVEGIALRRMLQDAVEIKNPETIAIMDVLLSESKKRKKVRLMELEGIPSPILAGILHPAIYLPSISFTGEELRGILLHEWTHYLQKDLLVKQFMCFVCAVFWWNPFVHILKRSLVHILELRCDAKAIRKCSEQERMTYLAAIVKILKYQTAEAESLRISKSAESASVLLIGEHKSSVEQRFALLLEQNQTKKHRVAAYAVYTTILLLFVVSNMFVIQPRYMNDEPGTFYISPETAYLSDNRNGTYSLYCEGEYWLTINENELSKEPYTLLEIK